MARPDSTWEKLSDYVLGRCSEQEANEIENRLRESEELLETYRIMSLLTEQEIRDDDEHWKALLTAYYADPNSLDDETRSKVEARLEADDEYRYDYEFLRSLDSELRASAQAESPAEKRQRSSLMEILWHWLKGPAIAYVLVALMIYPTVQWLSMSEKSAEQTTFFGGLPELTLMASTRGQAEVPSISLKADENVVRLEIPMYHAADKYRYEFDLRWAESGAPAATNLLPLFDQPGSITCILNARQLASGEYLLTVTETNRTDATDTATSSFLFRLDKTADQ